MNNSYFKGIKKVRSFPMKHRTVLKNDTTDFIYEIVYPELYLDETFSSSIKISPSLIINIVPR